MGNVSDLTLQNSVLWDDTASSSGDEISDLGNGTITVTYSDVEGGWTGTGNIDQDPGFEAPITSTWDTANDDVVYDATAYQTTFTDDSASFGSTDALVGLVFRGNTDNGNYTYIVASTGTTITVWGDVSGDYVNAKTYEVLDYRLDSGSPCIDTGDNTGVTDGTDPGDLDGNDRIVKVGSNCKVDMGAYEAAGSDCTP